MSRTKGTFIFILVVFLHVQLLAQSPSIIVKDTISRDLLNRYQAALSTKSGIYNGPQRPTYKTEIKGSPYFGESNVFKQGWVIYDGIKYENVSLKFDQFAGELITTYHSNGAELSLRNELVHSFGFSGHNFIHITKSDSISLQLPTGFYDVIYAGQHRVLARMNKSLKDFADIKDKSQYFDGKLIFYVRKNNKYNMITDGKGLEKLFKENKTALKKYIRANAINFKSDPERAVKMIAAWSDNLN